MKARDNEQEQKQAQDSRQIQPGFNKARGLGKDLLDPIHVPVLVPLNVPVL
jgi:hypothetical protein